jgi:hypothetical protein
MNFGNSILTDLITKLLESERPSRPLRSKRADVDTRSHRPRRASNSFADHPERW